MTERLGSREPRFAWPLGRQRSAVESRTRAVAYRTGGACCERRLSWPLSPRSPSLRLASPLIEPDVTISVIRLSDGFHGRHSQGRAAEVGPEPERPVPRIPPSRGTADTQARPACAVVGESGAPNDTNAAAHRGAPSLTIRSRSTPPSPAPCGSDD